MPVRIAINGFGRIGRNVLRSALIGGRTDLDLVAINDLTDAATLAHLFEFDSVHGRFPDNGIAQSSTAKCSTAKRRSSSVHSRRSVRPA